ncbi:MAG TPA: PKD domain-containing protein [bacterium]
MKTIAYPDRGRTAGHASRRGWGLACGVMAAACMLPAADHSVSAAVITSPTVAFLQEIAREYRQSGRIQEAIHELRKALLIDPDNEQIRREIAELETLKDVRRRRAMDTAIELLERSPAPPAVQPAPEPEPSEAPAAAPAVEQPAATEAPEPSPADPEPCSFAGPKFFQRLFPFAISDSAGISTGQAGRPPRADFRASGVSKTSPPAPRVRTARTALEITPPMAACDTFVFDASRSSDADRQPLLFRWEFGDGMTAEGERVEHTYAAPGTYDVALTVNDQTSSVCCESSVRRRVTVNLPPTAVLRAPAQACAGAPVALSAEESRDSPGDVLSYHWDFGDGTIATGRSVTHRWVRGGSYRVTLTVDDSRGTACSRAAASTLVRVNSPPSLEVRAPEPLCLRHPGDPADVILQARAGRDPDGDPMRVTWDFGDGTTGEGLRVTHRYDRGGRYTVMATADDGTGTACATARASVPVIVNRAPSAVIAPVGAGCPGLPLAMSARGSVDPDGDVLTYRWTFGDGRTGEGKSALHTYAGPGRYRLMLEVDDHSGMSCGTVRTDADVVINAPPDSEMVIMSPAGDVISPSP